jgi:DNA polymerase-4
LFTGELSVCIRQDYDGFMTIALPPDKTLSTHKIIHVDMDAFYASIEEREDPSLKGKPVVVGGSAEGRGVVSAANYAARKYGIRSAMPMIQALRRCRHLVRLPSRMELYSQVSHQIRDIFYRYTPLVQPLALDEAFLDVTASEKLFGSAEVIGRQIRDEIQDELKLVASVGIAPSKFVAKIASDIRKPGGFVVVDVGQVQVFLDPLPVSRIWGAGKVTVALFERMGIKTIGQLRRQSEPWLISHLGKFGQHLWQLANGIDDREVVTDGQAKSISHETTFSEDLTSQQQLEAWLLHLTEQVAWRLRKHELKGKTVVLKLRHHDFKTLTRSRSLPAPTDSTDKLWQLTRQLFVDNWDGKNPIRLIGMGVSGLFRQGQQLGLAEQGDLFEKAEDTKLDQLADNINARFGACTVQRGRARRK